MELHTMCMLEHNVIFLWTGSKKGSPRTLAKVHKLCPPSLFFQLGPCFTGGSGNFMSCTARSVMYSLTVLYCRLKT